MPATVRTGAGQQQEPGTPSRNPIGMAGIQARGSSVASSKDADQCETEPMLKSRNTDTECGHPKQCLDTAPYASPDKFHFLMSQKV